MFEYIYMVIRDSSHPEEPLDRLAVILRITFEATLKVPSPNL